MEKAVQVFTKELDTLANSVKKAVRRERWRRPVKMFSMMEKLGTGTSGRTEAANVALKRGIIRLVEPIL